MTLESDEYYMRLALKIAQTGADQGEVPVGAVLVDQAGTVIGRGMNSPIAHSDPTAHAEINALRQAAQLQKNYRLPQTRLYVTIEPCCMCYGALVHARVAELIYAAPESKAGAVSSGLSLGEAACFNHQIVVRSGVLLADSKALIQSFFANRRRSKVEV